MNEPGSETPRTVTEEMVSRFLGWSLPIDFAPDCGISFDGCKGDEGNKNKSWPIGTNLFTAVQAREMLEHVLNDGRERALASEHDNRKQAMTTEAEASTTPPSPYERPRCPKCGREIYGPACPCATQYVCLLHGVSSEAVCLHCEAAKSETPLSEPSISDAAWEILARDFPRIERANCEKLYADRGYVLRTREEWAARGKDKAQIMQAWREDEDRLKAEISVLRGKLAKLEAEEDARHKAVMDALKIGTVSFKCGEGLSFNASSLLLDPRFGNKV